MPKLTEETKRKRRKFTSDEVDELTKKAAEDAAAQVRAEQTTPYIEEPQLNSDSFDFGTEEDPPEAELRAEQERKNAFDLFEYVENNFSKNGTMVSYSITKDGARLQDRPHPLSWSKLQAKHGGGTYTVTAREALHKTYIKTQTLLLADLEEPEVEERPIIQAQPQMDLNGVVAQVLTMVQSLQEMNAHRKDTDSREDKSSQNNMLTAVMSMMQGQQQAQTSQQQATQTLFMEFQKSMMLSLQHQSDQTQKILEKMDEKNTRIFEKLASKKEDGMDSMTMLGLLQKAEDRGWEKMKTVMELAQDQAEEIAANQSPDSERTGIMSSLAGAIVPLLTAASQNIPRGPLPPPEPQAPVGASQGVRPQARNAPRPSPKPVTPRSETKGQDLGPSFARPQTFAKVAPVPTDKVETNEVDALYASATTAQQTIAVVAIPIIANFIYDDTVSPEQAGLNVLSALEGQGFSAGGVIKDFPLEFMLKTAKTFGIGDDKKPWFEKMYGFIESKIIKEVPIADIQAPAGNVVGPSLS